MNTPTVLAELYAGILVLVGVSMLNKRYITSVFNDIAGNNALLWVTGFVTFLIGLVSVSLYNVWSSDWTVLVTIAGWLTLLKGIVLTVFPKTAVSFYRKMLHRAVPVAGFVAIILGAILYYFVLVG